MKKFVIGMMLFAVAQTSFSQSSNTQIRAVNTDYLAKSKKQKTVAYAIAIPGSILFSAGCIMYLSEYKNGLPGGTNYSGSKTNTGEVLMIAGGATMLVSVPFSIASKKNKKKAMSAGIIMEKGDPDKGYSMRPASYPAVSIRFKLL